MGKKRDGPTAWEIAKPLLEKDYLDRVFSVDDPPREVVLLRPEYQKVPYNNFRTNLLAMKKRVGTDKDRAIRDDAGYVHDVAIYKLACDEPSCWDGSLAQQSLIVDVKCGMHKFMKPKDLWHYREEYQEFPLQEFRGHNGLLLLG